MARSIGLAVSVILALISSLGASALAQESTRGSAVVVPDRVTVDFGEVRVGRVAQAVVLLRNEGDAGARWWTYGFSPSPGDFEYVKPYGISQGETRELVLKFAPQAVGAHAATFNAKYYLSGFIGEERSASFSIEVRGQGIEPPDPPTGCTFEFPDEGGYLALLEGGAVACGSPGRDVIRTMRGGIFHGNGGDDLVTYQYGGTVYGGEGIDDVRNLRVGTFFGGAGDDNVSTQDGGRFVGGPGDDDIRSDQNAGVFEGLDGDDSVSRLRGTFRGGAGDDEVRLIYGGTFDGGPGDDRLVFDNEGGLFLGGPGDDIGGTMEAGGVFKGGPGGDLATYVRDGIFFGGAGPDRAQSVRGPRAKFKAGPGIDKVRDVAEGGTFYGARGHDVVSGRMWDRGTFHGGPGRDSARIICDATNTFTSVEVKIRGC